MAVFKCVNQSYDWENTVESLCAYIMDPEKTFGYVGGESVRPEYAALEMNVLKKTWGKEGGRQMRHFILSFSDDEPMTAAEALTIAQSVAMYYGSRYQIIYAVHVPGYGGEHYHIHFGMNTVSFIDGVKYSGALHDYHKLRKVINDILREYGYRLEKVCSDDDHGSYGYFGEELMDFLY